VPDDSSPNVALSAAFPVFRRATRTDRTQLRGLLSKFQKKITLHTQKHLVLSVKGRGQLIDGSPPPSCSLIAVFLDWNKITNAGI
jgi:hypothetical protein